MRILTISASPHLLTRNGRINHDVIKGLKSQGHHVESVVWNHDPIHFMPNEAGEHVFYDSDGIMAKLHPFLGEKGEFTPFLYEKMKVTQPDVVVTIGTYRESADIWPIKMMYGRLFKWLAILTDGSPFLNEHHGERLQYPDSAICTSKCGLKAFRKISSTPSEYIPYGPSKDFHPLENELPEQFGVISLAKNSQMCNPGAFIKASAKARVAAFLHTNIDDDGEYDLRLLKKRYDPDGFVALPDLFFVSLREGVKAPLLNMLYNRSHAVVDCSMQSATALTMLEAMSTGCVPVGMDFGAVGEVLEKVAEPYRFVVPHSVFVGPNEEEYAIPDVDGLADVLSGLKERLQNEMDWFKEAREHAISVSAIFSKEKFISRVNEIVNGAVAWLETIAVDIY